MLKALDRLLESATPVNPEPSAPELGYTVAPVMTLAEASFIQADIKHDIFLLEAAGTAEKDTGRSLKDMGTNAKAVVRKIVDFVIRFVNTMMEQIKKFFSKYIQAPQLKKIKDKQAEIKKYAEEHPKTLLKMTKLDRPANGSKMDEQIKDDLNDILNGTSVESAGQNSIDEMMNSAFFAKSIKKDPDFITKMLTSVSFKTVDKVEVYAADLDIDLCVKFLESRSAMEDTMKKLEKAAKEAAKAAEKDDSEDSLKKLNDYAQALVKVNTERLQAYFKVAASLYGVLGYLVKNV